MTEKIEENSSQYKGWTRPGPHPPGADLGTQPESGESLDFICGHYRIFQLIKGHRYSTDDVITGWYGTSWVPRADYVLDLGSGIGAVATVAAWRLPGARLVTIEAQEESVRLARKTHLYNGISERVDVRLGDFRDTNTCFSGDERFDLVLGSPPYFPLDSGVLGDHPQKIACRFEVRGDIADYCRVASERLTPGGLFVCVFPIDPPHQLARIRDAAESAGLAVIRIRSVVLKEGNPPLLGLFGMSRKSDLPTQLHSQTWMEPPLTIRTREGLVHPEYSAIKLSFGFPPL